MFHNLDTNFIQKSISKFTKTRTFESKYTLTLPEDMHVRFESRFENGNLKKVAKISDYEYNLVLSYDYNTKGHTQWYYFKMCANFEAGM